MKEKVLDLLPKDETEKQEEKEARIPKQHRISAKEGVEPIVKRIVAKGKQAGEETERKEETAAKEAAQNKAQEGSRENEAPKDVRPVTEKVKPVKVRKPLNPLIFKRLAAAVAAVLVLTYLTGAVVFARVFYPETTLNGIGCGLKTASETEQLISDAISGYQIEVQGRNGLSGTISSGEINLTPVFHGEVKETLKGQHPFKWFLLFSKPVDYSIEEVTLYSKEALRKCVSDMPFFSVKNIVAQKDAYIGDITDEGYVITKEDNGAVPLEGNIVTAVATAVDTLDRTVDIDNDSCYEPAKVTSTDKELNTLLNNLNNYCAAKIVYRFGDDEEVLDGSMISEWITVDGTEVSFDESKVSDYVKALARKHDTFGQPHKFKAHNGEEMTITQGAYGWWIDRPAETAELIEAIKSGYRGERTPVYKAEGAQYGDTDYGDNYVEIDLTSQHLWVYKEGKEVLDSDFVSGNVSKNNGTHVGIYGITYKEKDATLSGANYSSHVNYWMPFNGNEGMHDATWRSSFGGDIYLTSGSHGCVNLPLEKAEKIFGLVEKGEAVIVYGGKTYTPPAAAPEEPVILDPMQQLQLLIDAGILNPDGTIPETTTVQE